MKLHDSKIIADGADRYRAAKNYREVRRQLIAQATERYRGAIENASVWRRWWILLRIRREVRVELRKEFPPAALHAFSPR
jgi:hypothetical protein